MRGEVAVIGYLVYLDVWNMEHFREHLERSQLTEEDERTLSDLGI
jgi:DNA-binding transcriptional regulator/RsmH inhibitor MraZ